MPQAAATPPVKPQSPTNASFLDTTRTSGDRVLLSGRVIACPEDRKIPYKESVSSRSEEVSPTLKRSVSAGKVVQVVDSGKRHSIGAGCRSGEIITATKKCLRKSWEGSNGAKDAKDRTTPNQAKQQVKAAAPRSSSVSKFYTLFSLPHTLGTCCSNCKEFVPGHRVLLLYFLTYTDDRCLSFAWL
jgi:hypothetical protein